MRPQKHSACDSDKSGQRRKRVAAMMPRICNHHLRMYALASIAGIAEKPLLQQYREQSHGEGHPSGRRKRMPVHRIPGFFGAIDKKQDSHYRENHRKQHGGESLKLTVAILKVAVGLPPGDTDKYQNYYICKEIGKGVHAVDYHCRGTSKDTGNDLQCA